MDDFIGLISVILIFSVPIVAIVTNFFKSREKIKLQILEKELELEKLKNENFLLETEKMRMELQKMELDGPKDEWVISRDR
jgi:competence protein ComGC